MVSHVQLPYERAEVVVLEVLGEHKLGEVGDVLDDDAVAGGVPAAERVVLVHRKYVEELDDEAAHRPGRVKVARPSVNHWAVAVLAHLVPPSDVPAALFALYPSVALLLLAQAIGGGSGGGCSSWPFALALW
jgi:hypothetical protein